MTAGLWVAAVYIGIALAWWLANAWVVLRVHTKVPRLEEVSPPEPQCWPRLTVVVPARDEARDLEDAARTLLAQDYPDLEIILVDDRSTDGTSGIVDRLAAGDERVQALHVTELPAGWLGKVHALQLGFERSTGAFVLFTDADVHFRPDVLRRAVAYAVDRDLGFLTAFPSLWPTSLFLDSMIAAFLRQLFIGTRPWNFANPKSKAFIGVGAFNMVRRSAFERTEGFEWLRMETADDAGLGYMMKKSGARVAAVTAFEHLALYWYRTPGEAVRGAEKGFASVLKCSVVRAIVLAGLVLALELSPVLVLLPLLLGDTGVVAFAGLGVFAVFVFSVVTLARLARARVLPGLLTPLSAVFLAWVFLRVALTGRRRGGALWRGTLYTSEELLAGRRIPLP